LCYRQRKVLS